MRTHTSPSLLSPTPVSGEQRSPESSSLDDSWVLSDLLAQRSVETEPVEDNQPDGHVRDSAASPTTSQEPENNADLPNEATEGKVHNTAKAKAAAEAAGAERDKAQAEEVVRAAAISLLQLGKRHAEKMVQQSVMMQRRLAVKRNPH
ncbi:unnamed protein product [Phytophthora fragariaefolia]|uniref:Unnamed protein product n=1 Tax=Phytophthora fragariaefolia TaxID=1490495 RepID=A0A9W6XNP8_9STRA|nr:unnamed protein product [Phytophthora fragariaefolia]